MSIELNQRIFTIKPENIYNLDESWFTICQKPQEIIALKGKKSVGAITSTEKGKNITVVSVSGSYVPPYLFFQGLEYQLMFGWFTCLVS